MSALISVQEYEAQAADLFNQAKGILTDPASKPEDIAKVDQMITDAKALKEKAFKLEDVSKEAAKIVETTSDKSKPIGPNQFKNWGEFVEAIGIAFKGGKRDPRLVAWKDAATPDERKDLVENVGASGGFLVPTEFYAQLMAIEGEAGIVRPRATKIRMARRAVDVPVLDQTTTTAGIGHWFGGMQFYWIEEATSKTETNAKFRKITLVANKLIGYTEASDELLADSAISLGDFFNSSLGFAGGIAWMEDYAFLRGTGAGQPQGVVNAGATITVARQAIGTPIQYLDIVNMMESFLPSARGVWVLNQSCMSNLFQMTVGTMNVWQPNMQAGVPGSLFGMPVIFTEKLPTVGNAGDVLLADFRYYLIGDRQATTIESTQFYQWQYDLTSWRAVHRVDGQPWLSAPLTYQDGTIQVSPFVILGAKTT